MTLAHDYIDSKIVVLSSFIILRVVCNFLNAFASVDLSIGGLALHLGCHGGGNSRALDFAQRYKFVFGKQQSQTSKSTRIPAPAS